MTKNHAGINRYIGNPTVSSGTAKGIFKMQDQLGLNANAAWVQDGLSSATAGTSAVQLKNDFGYNTDGVYWINLPSVGPTQIYCIMNSAYDGGGWMMALKATTGTTFNYSANYWTTTNTLNPSDVTRNNADAKYNTFNYFKAKDLLAVWPDITTGTGGSITGQGVWTWLENNFYLNRIEPVNFFNSNLGVGSTSGGTGYFKKDAKTFSGWASGIFTSQTDIRFYGFNYYPWPGYATAAGVRWGFGWNENGEGLWPSLAPVPIYLGSNDVSGGIGMDTGFGSYSAGDKLNCCNDTTGINRSARVEVYIR
jgi:hypothetical protein